MVTAFWEQVARGSFRDVTGVHLDAHTRSAVERLCLLVGDGGSPLLISHLKELLQQVWVRRFDLDTTREDVQAATDAQLIISSALKPIPS